MAAELKAKISLHTTEFEKGIEFAKHQAESLKETFLSTAEKIGAALGVAFSVEAFAEGIKGALEFGETMERLSARTGAPIRDLVIMQKEFKNAGLAAEDVGPAINRLQKALTGVNERGEPTNKTFEKLGLNINEIRKLNPQDQFAAIGKAIGNLQSPSERAAAAMALFGRNGGELLNIFRSDNAFGKAQEQVGAQADLLGKNAERFAAVSRSLESISGKFRGFFIGVASEILPKLEAIMDIISGIHLEEMGRKFGESLSSSLNILVNAFKQGKLGELLGLSLQIGLETAANYALGLFSSIISSLSHIVDRLFREDFLSSFVVGLAGLGDNISATLIEAFKTPLAYLQAGFETAAAKLAEFIRPVVQPIADLLGVKLNQSNEGELGLTFDQRFERDKKENSGFATGLAAEGNQLIDESGAGLKNTASDIWSILVKDLHDFQPSDLFNTKDLIKQFEDLADVLDVPIEGVRKLAEESEKTSGLGDLVEKRKSGSSRVEADRFTRLGLFTGGGSNGAIDFARRTADNTQKMAQHLATLVSKSQATMATGGASWSDD